MHRRAAAPPIAMTASIADRSVAAAAPMSTHDSRHTRREVTGLLLAATLVASPRAGGTAAHAQPQQRMPTVGTYALERTAGPNVEFLRQGLRERGWIEGRNFRLEILFLGGYEGNSAVMAEFVRLPVDVIFVQSVVAATAARDATASIPIVFWMGADPVSAGLVESYARPGRNLTGIFGSALEGVAKQLELLREAVPHVRRVALLLNPANPNLALAAQQARQAAADLGLQLLVVAARNAAELTDGLAQMTRARVDALVFLGGGALWREAGRIAEFALANRLPAITGPGQLKAATLLSFAPSQRDGMQRAAHYIDRILKGAKPADLPVERATRFELVIDLKVARAIGVVVPDALLRIADEVID